MTERVNQDRDEFARFKRDTWNATDYDSWFKPARGQVIDNLEKAALEKALAGRKYDRALDVGIGNGRLLPIYAPHAAHVTGMDISSEQLEQAIAGGARNSMFHSTPCFARKLRGSRFPDQFVRPDHLFASAPARFQLARIRR